MNAPIRQWAEVRTIQAAAEETWWMELHAPGIAASAVPGQFLMAGLGLTQVGAPFLPRPFSVGWTDRSTGTVGLLIREFGEGTRRLARLRDGDQLLLLGPLGRSFRIPSGRPLVVVGGGVGLAPFLFLTAEASNSGVEVRLLYGERTADRVFDPALIAKLTGVEPIVFTEDGSTGRHGLVLDGIDVSDDPILLGCGPTPMLNALETFARERGSDLQVSVEEHMGCGVGTCQGCVVRSADGSWLKSCTEGPVFDASDLAWPI
jgi:dihydroorotate dehydrogenase electron transfer subunit